MRTSRAKRAMLCLVLVLAACGGGGGGTAPPVIPGGPTELKAAVQANRCALVDAAAVVDGSGSTGPAPIRYAWTLVRKPDQSTASLQRADTAQPGLVPDRAGTYELRLVVSDGTRNSDPATATLEAVARSAPVAAPTTQDGVRLEVSPSDGDPVPASACMPVSGTATSSVAGTMTVSFRLLTGDVGDLGVSPFNAISPASDTALRESALAPFFRTNANALATVADLSGLAPGLHTLSVQAIDSAGNRNTVRRRVLVTDPAARLPAPLGYLPADSAMRALEQEQLVYLQSFPGDFVRLRDLRTGNERTLGRNGAFESRSWGLSNGFAYASSIGRSMPDCVNLCVYEFAPDGAVRNLSNASPYSTSTEANSGGRSADFTLRTRGGFVSWANFRGPDLAVGLTVYEQATGSYSEIVVPGGAIRMAPSDYDLAVAGGVAYVAFLASTPAGGVEVFLWDSASRSSRQLTSGGLQNISVTAGPTRVTWQQLPAPGGAEARLFAAPLAGGAAVTLGTIRSWGHALQAGGVVAWHDATDILRANGGARTDTVSSASSRLLTAGSGAVVFTENQDLYTWSAASDTRTLRLRGFAYDALISNGQMLLQVGTTLYRVPI